MKVFLDANVLVSAFATRGLCADLFDITSIEHGLVVGELVVKQVRRVLRERIHVRAAAIDEIAALLRTNTIAARPREHLRLGIRDPDEEWVVASAVSAAFDVLLTVDAELHALKKPAIRIVTPCALWDLLRAPGK